MKSKFLEWKGFLLVKLMHRVNSSVNSIQTTKISMFVITTVKF